MTERLTGPRFSGLPVSFFNFFHLNLSLNADSQRLVSEPHAEEAACSAHTYNTVQPFREEPYEYL